MQIAAGGVLSVYLMLWQAPSLSFLPSNPAQLAPVSFFPDPHFHPATSLPLPQADPSGYGKKVRSGASCGKGRAIVLLCCSAGQGSVPQPCAASRPCACLSPKPACCHFHHKPICPCHTCHRAARRVRNEAPESSQCRHCLLDGRSGTAPIA